MTGKLFWMISRRFSPLVGLAIIASVPCSASAQQGTATLPLPKAESPAESAEQNRLRAMHDAIYVKQHPEIEERKRVWRQVFDICQQFWTAALPTDIDPTNQELEQFEKDQRINGEDYPCSSERLYLGEVNPTQPANAYVPPDLAASRRCAILRAKASAWWADDFQGYKMLAILSANGEGVPQSWPAAMHYECLAVTWGGGSTDGYDRMMRNALTPDDIPTSNLGGVLSLYAAMQSGRKPGDYDGCENPVDDENLNRREVEPCAEFRNRKIMTFVGLNDFDRRNVDYSGDGELARRASSFDTLLEGDISALEAMTVSADAMKREGAVERHQYDEAVDRLARRDYPKLLTADLTRSDADLNRLYKEMKCWLGCRLDPSIGQKFQDAERSWIAYRDVLVGEAVKAVPEPDKGAVKTAMLAQFTQDRVDDFNRWIDLFQSAPTNQPQLGPKSGIGMK